MIIKFLVVVRETNGVKQITIPKKYCELNDISKGDLIVIKIGESN